MVSKFPGSGKQLGCLPTSTKSWEGWETRLEAPDSGVLHLYHILSPACAEGHNSLVNGTHAVVWERLSSNSACSPIGVTMGRLLTPLVPHVPIPKMGH